MLNGSEFWWKSPFQMFQTNLREIDVLLDVNQVLDDIQSNGANAWLLNVGGILAHYPTDLDCHTRNPHLSRRKSGDLVADAVEAAHARGVKILGRMDFSKVPLELAQKNPDWCFIGPDGDWQVYQGLVSMCPSGSYYQEHVFHILDEIMSRYSLDGFFFNWFGFNEVDYSGVYHGVCHCVNCKEKFRALSGKSLPDHKDHVDYPEWIHYTRSVTDALTQRFVHTIETRLPGACLILGQSAHVLFHEANNAIGREFWPYRTLENVTALKATHSEKPVLVNSVAFYDMPYRMVAEEKWMYRQYYMQAIAAGANVSSYIMGPTRNIQYRNVEQVSDIAHFQNKWREKYSGTVSSADLALVRPDMAGSQLEFGEDSTSLAEYRGWFQVLSKHGVPFDVIAQEHLDKTELGKYTAMILPHLPKLSDTQSNSIYGYLFKGGKVGATGASGLSLGSSGEKIVADWLPVTDVEKVITDPEELKSSYVALDVLVQTERLVEGSRLLPLTDFHVSASWAQDAELHYWSVPSAPFGPPEKAYGHNLGPKGAVARSKVGAGQILYIPFVPGATRYDWGLQALSDFMFTSLTDLLGYTPSILATDEFSVSVTRQKQRSGNQLLHVINTSGFGRVYCDKPITQHDVSFRIIDSKKFELHDLTSGEEVPILDAGDYHRFVIPTLNEMAVIEIRYIE